MLAFKFAQSFTPKTFTKRIESLLFSSLMKIKILAAQFYLKFLSRNVLFI